LGTFLEAILWKRIQIFLRILNDISSITKPVHSMLISVEATGKSQLDSDQYYGALLLCRHFVLYEQILNQNRPVCWSILVMDKPYSCSLLFGAIPSDRIHNSTKEINVPKFPSFSKFCKLYQLIPGIFWSSYVWFVTVDNTFIVVVIICEKRRNVHFRIKFKYIYICIWNLII